MAVFPALVLLGVGACAAALVALAYGVTAYANALAGNSRAFWREARRGFVAFAVLLACTGGIVAIAAATDSPPSPSPERNTPSA